MQNINCKTQSYMTTQRVVFFFLFILSATSLQRANAKPTSYQSIDDLPFTNSIKAVLKKGGIYSDSKVESFIQPSGKGKKQSLNFQLAGLHPKKCRFALRKISRYEEYQNYLGVVGHSSYNDQTKKIRLLLTSKLLPINMLLSFKIPRVRKEGQYGFTFDKGFLKNLKGTIFVSSHKNQCLFFVTASWVGPHTGFNNILFEFFSSAVPKLGMKNLFRISSIP